MRIYYLTDDPPNKEWAQEIAERLGIDLFPMSSNERPFLDEYPLVIDLDNMLLAREEYLDSLLRSPPVTRPVSVHSYNLSEETEAALRAKGVGVYSSLRRAFLQFKVRDHKAVQKPQRKVAGPLVVFVSGAAAYRPNFSVILIVTPRTTDGSGTKAGLPR
jgi:hypothetical protein